MEYHYLLKSGTILSDKYRIQSVIGQGGMSLVYQAEDIRLGKKWAVKEISPYTCGNFGQISRVLAGEAEILTRLDHPSLPRIVDIFHYRQSVMIVMDYIHGRNLRDLLMEQGSFDEEQVVDWGIQLARVLAYLHSRNPPIIYRDMKPSNIMVEEGGKLKLIDFGTAREYSGTEEGDTVCLGTRGYAAPEQYGGCGQSDDRTDVYGLGVTLYQLITGKDPSAPPYTLLPVRQLLPHVSPGLESIIERCTRPNPEERFSSMEDLSYALGHLEESGTAFLDKEKKKLVIQAVIIAAAILCFLASAITGNVRKSKIRSLAEFYSNQALYASDNQDKTRYYSMALELVPEEGWIYRNILDDYREDGELSTADETAIISLTSHPVRDGCCLDLLRKKNTLEYCAFCYDMGLACFFDMGGKEGKRDAWTWFDAVWTTQAPAFDSGKRKRAGCYRRISDYYRTYIDRGDQNGETDKSYRDFFAVLVQLNRADLDMESADAEVAAAYYISKEVLMEISMYADCFARDGITAGDMHREIRRIRTGEKQDSFKGRISRMEIFRQRRSDRDYRDLEKLLEDAERKADMEKESVKTE